MIAKGFDYLGLATSSIITALLAQRYGLSAKTLFLLPLAIATGPLFLIDATTMRLPNAILYPAIFTSLAIIVGYSIYTSEIGKISQFLIKGIAFFLTFFLLYIITNGGIGAGDAKLALLIGLCIGIFSYSYLFFILFGSFFFAALYSLLLMARKQASLKSKIPFGPFLLISTWTCALLPGNLLL